VDAFIHDASQWAVREALFLPDNGEVLRRMAELGLKHGLPFDRLTTHLKVLHPSMHSVARIWRSDRPMEERFPVRSLEHHPSYLTSPVKRVWETGSWIERRLGPSGQAPDPDGFAILDDLKREGFTHYLIGPLVFSDRESHALSFATKAPSGFTAPQREDLRELAQILAPVIEVKALRRRTAGLMETYLGHDTVELLTHGRVELGDGERRRAALWYSDLRGFTSLTEDQPLDAVVSVINDYFGLVGATAARHGGQVVQFIGDAILIYFAVPEDGLDAVACRRALDAAGEARRELAAWNRLRARSALPPIEFGLGLDFGNIIHVNVGAEGRQAFNIVGPAVNRAARIEELTKALGRPVLASGDFAAALGQKLRSLGPHRLRGIAQPVEIVEPRDGPFAG
jgi:adenylate cyclase